MKFNTKRIRAILLVLLVLSVFLMYGVRLMKMQIVEGDEYSKLANAGFTQTQTIPAARGEITDRNGVLLAKNKTVFNVVFDKAYFPSGDTNKESQKLMNDIILKAVGILKDQGEEWTDNLPITKTNPFLFDETKPNGVDSLKSFLDIGGYASVNDAIYWLKDRYGLQEYTEEEVRILAGIRYEMERVGFSVKNRYTFAEDVSMDTVTKISENSVFLPGVDTDVSTKREYVNGDVLPHLLGGVGAITAENKEYYVDEKGYPLNATVGTSGIESLMEDYLRGKDGEREIKMDSEGNVIDSKTTKSPVPGNSVVLTIDSKLQRVALDAMQKEIEYLNKNAPSGEGREACAGAVVAIDVKTGEILTMASYPSYNLETFNEDYEELRENELNPLYNRALYGEYTPGSIFKPVVATAALENGLIDEYSTVSCRRVYTRFDDYQPRCLGYHGPTTVIKALQRSCNIFFYDVGFRLGIDKVDYYSKMYGLGEYTGIEFENPDNPYGLRANPQEREEAGGMWNPGDVLQASIGQSDNRFTPLQLATYCATIANQGKRYNSHIIKEIQDYNTGEAVHKTQTELMSDMNMSDYTYQTLLKGLKAAAGQGGTSYDLFIDYPVTVAAKTGTPETSQFPNSTYIAFAPAENPKIAVCVVIEKGWHGYTGAPVAKYIFNEYFGIEDDVRLIS